MRPKILVEGPDGAGKTTLCKSLAEFYNIPYLKFSQSKTVDEAVELTNKVADEYEACIIDRVKAMDHRIYGELIDGIDFTSEEEYRLRQSLEHLIVSSERFHIVYLYGDPEVLWQRIKSRDWDDDYIQKHHLPELMKFYRYYLGSRKETISIDTTELNPLQVFARVIREVGK